MFKVDGFFVWSRVVCGWVVGVGAILPIIIVAAPNGGADAHHDAWRLDAARLRPLARRAQVANLDGEETARVGGALVHGEKVARGPEGGMVVPQQRGMRVLLVQGNGCDEAGALWRLDVDVGAVGGEGGEVQHVLVGMRMRPRGGLCIAHSRRLSACSVAKDSVGERPGALARHRRKARLDALHERVDRLEGVVEAARGIVDVVEAATPVRTSWPCCVQAMLTRCTSWQQAVYYIYGLVLLSIAAIEPPQASKIK